MPRRQTSKIIFAALIALYPLLGNAMEKNSGGSGAIPCAVLSDFEGELEILDPSRAKILEVTPHTGIPCGGWVSVESGWAEIKHRNGFRIKIGAQSFAQVAEDNVDGHHGGDHFVLYKGQALLQADEGTGELRAITANARVRVENSAGILVFNSTSEESQFTALQKKSWFENRFETSRRVAVAAGESSSLNFKLLRVIPTAPQVATVSGVKSKLGAFQVSALDRAEYMENAKARATRKFASSLDAPAKNAKNRAPASSDVINAAYTVQNRKSAQKEESAALHKHLVRKLTAGESVGEQILHPGEFYGQPKKVSVTVMDPAAKMLRKKAEKEDSEKRRLIEELSKIRD